MADKRPHRSFAPIVAPDTRLLLLGSLPGAASLAAERYYAHPRNQFWRLMSGVIGTRLETLPYETRLQVLRAAGVGLWDTVAVAHRKGSLDADIRLIEHSDLNALIARLPRLRAIGFNGGTAARIGRKTLGAQVRASLIDLPSSSPAYTLAFEEKLRRWTELRQFLQP